jgi:UDP-N-acetyl-D-glucosamine dehydrogenase
MKCVRPFDSSRNEGRTPFDVQEVTEFGDVVDHEETRMSTLLGPTTSAAGREPFPFPRRPPDLDAPARTVAVVGLGYVGLPTALSFAAAGLTVVGYDVSEERLAAITGHRVDAAAEDRAALAAELGSDRLVLTSDAGCLAEADAVVVCVPTPIDPHLVPDLGAIGSACATVVAHARPGQTIVLTSTTYVGCTDDLLVEPLRLRGLEAGRDVFVAFSPERIDPGVAEHSPRRTPRVVGGVTEECGKRAAELLAPTSPEVHPVSSTRAAELTKLLENTFRAVNIALANEFSDVTRAFGVDPVEVIAAAATKPYGFMPFYPGPGVGGHCIPCDPHYLLWQLRRQRSTSPVTEAAMWSIATRPRAVVRRAREVLGDLARPVAGARILVLGVTYKPGVADVRESPALEILAELRRAGAVAAYHDPLVPVLRVDGVESVSQPDPGADDWDLVIAHTLHPGLDLGWIQSAGAVLDTTYRLAPADNRRLL